MLKEWQKQDAANLKALLDQAREQPEWEGQATFAERHDLGSQSMLSQYASGTRPLNLKAAIALARAFGVPVARISPTLAKRLVDVPPAFDGDTPPPPPSPKPAVKPLDSALLAALGSLEPDVRMAIRNMIHALATAKSASYQRWVSEIEAHNHRRDATKPKKGARAKASRIPEE